MPLYQFFCEQCHVPHEVLMSLKEIEKVDTGKDWIECPECREKLKKLMCPVRFKIK